MSGKRAFALEGLRVPYLDLLAKKHLGGGLKSGFVFLSAGTGMGQALAVIASPILSRTYTPGDFGVLAIFTAITAIVVSVAALRFEQAIPLPENDVDAAAVMAVSGIGIGLVAGISALAVWCLEASGTIPAFLAPARRYLMLLPFAIAGAGAQTIFLNWTLRKRGYALIARTKVWQSLVLVACQVSFGLLHAKAWGLVTGYTIGQLAGTRLLARAAWKEDRSSFSAITWERMRRMTGRFFRFPVFGVPSALMFAGTRQVPSFVLAATYGVEVTGCFSFSQRVFSLPIALIGQSLGQAFFAEVARDLSEDRSRIFPKFKRVTKAMAAMGLGVASVALAAPLWFPLVFGPQWRPAAIYSQLLSFAFFTDMAFSNTNNFGTFGLNSWQLAWDFFRVSLLCLVSWEIASHPGSDITAVGLLAASSAVGYLVVYYPSREAHRRASTGAVKWQCAAAQEDSL